MPLERANEASVTPFRVQEVQVRPDSLATMVTVMTVPTLAVPPDMVADVVAAGVLASIVCAEDSTRVVCRVGVLAVGQDNADRGCPCSTVGVTLHDCVGHRVGSAAVVAEAGDCYRVQRTGAQGVSCRIRYNCQGDGSANLGRTSRYSCRIDDWRVCVDGDGSTGLGQGGERCVGVASSVG